MASANSDHSRPSRPAAIAQSVQLIWLDRNVSCQYTMKKLRKVIHCIHVMTHENPCVDLLRNSKRERFCLIVSGSIGKGFTPTIHEFPCLDSIFIFCHNKSANEQWAAAWPKIKGVFTEISPICEALQEVVRQCEHDAISINIISSKGSTQNVAAFNAEFMYTKILKEILLKIDFGQQHFQEFLSYCREQFADDDNKVHKIRLLDEQYYQRSPIWWYSNESLLYSMINRALRTLDVDMIVKMGFFLRDLQRRLEILHAEQNRAPQSFASFPVYRGQGLEKADFEALKKGQGELISFNSFLSTSKDSNIAMNFAKEAIKNPDMLGILFVINVNPSMLSIPFASIGKESHYSNEQEVLFSMHTVFRINSVEAIEGQKHRLWRVNLTFTSERDPDMVALTEHIRRETFPQAVGWYRLALFLIKMNHFDKAKQICEMKLKQTSNELERAFIYHQIGWIHMNQQQYQDAMAFNIKALEIRTRQPNANPADLASSLNNLGLVHFRLGNYQQALGAHQKALEIRQKLPKVNHVDIATSYANLGAVFCSIKNYPKALEFFEKDLAINERLLPAKHPDLAMSYWNMGLGHYELNNYDKALLFYEKALVIREKSLTSGHLDLAATYNGIGIVHEKLSHYADACLYFDKALKIQENNLPSDDVQLAKTNEQLGAMYCKLGKFNNALFSLKTALKIYRKTMPETDPNLLDLYDTLAFVCQKLH